MDDYGTYYKGHIDQQLRIRWSIDASTPPTYIVNLQNHFISWYTTPCGALDASTLQPIYLFYITTLPHDVQEQVTRHGQRILHFHIYGE